MAFAVSAKFIVLWMDVSYSPKLPICNENSKKAATTTEINVATAQDLKAPAVMMEDFCRDEVSSIRVHRGVDHWWPHRVS